MDNLLAIFIVAMGNHGSHEALCKSLKLFAGLKEDCAIMEAFRHVDRADFLLEEDRSNAYSDGAIMSGPVHISAPNIYAEVLKGLELEKGMTFLNTGSGSGYLSCLVSHIIGPTGLCRGIDVNSDAVEHARTCTEKWLTGMLDIWFPKSASCSSASASSETTTASKTPEWKLREHEIAAVRESVSFVEGNCFHIDFASTIEYARYDRIYVGAGCLDEHSEFFYNMLQVGGILILPLEEELVKVTHISEFVFHAVKLMDVAFRPLQLTDDVSDRVRAAKHYTRRDVEQSASEVATMVHSDGMRGIVQRLSGIGQVTSLEENRRFVNVLDTKSKATDWSTLVPPINYDNHDNYDNNDNDDNNYVNNGDNNDDDEDRQTGYYPESRGFDIGSLYEPVENEEYYHTEAEAETVNGGSTVSGGGGGSDDDEEEEEDGAHHPDNEEVVQESAYALSESVSTAAVCNSNTVTAGSSSSSAAAVDTRAEKVVTEAEWTLIALPTVVWAPNKYRHNQFPTSFRRAVLTVLMCVRFTDKISTSNISQSSTSGSIPRRRHNNNNGRTFASIPAQLWLVIFTYCTRDWFLPPPSAAELLLQEMLFNKRLMQHAERALGMYRKME